MTSPLRLIALAPALIFLASSAAAASDAAILDAARAFQESGRAPVLAESDAVVYPFGESQPVLRCAPLRACDVELEAGEVVHGVALGDTERWLTSPLYSGHPENLVPHVVVKPRETGISTNLIITTTRRTYHLLLESPPGDVAVPGYLRRVRFYYPGDLVQQWSEAAELAAAGEARRRDATVATLAGGVDPAALNFDYRLGGDRRAPFRPLTVFDDGRHVYIRLPPAVAAGDAPALLARTAGGEEVILNYRMDGAWIVVEGLFERGELVDGVGRKRRTVEIVNQAFPADAEEAL